MLLGVPSLDGLAELEPAVMLYGLIELVEEEHFGVPMAQLDLHEVFILQGNGHDSIDMLDATQLAGV